MDTQTVAAMQQAANPQSLSSQKSDPAPSHLVPADQAAAASKKLASSLLNLNAEQPSAAPTDVAAIQEAIRQQTDNKGKLHDVVRKKLNLKPVEVEPQTVADPLVVSEVKTAPEPEVKEEASTPEPQPAEQPAGEEDSKNFKNLKNLWKKEAQTAKQLLEEKNQLEEKVKKYESGEELPPPALQLKEKVRQLEPLQDLLNFKTSDATNDILIQPLNQATEKLNSLAADYGIPGEVIEQAFGLKNERDLNTFLENEFGTVGALEAKAALKDVRRLRGELKAAEAKPKEALERLTQEHLLLREAQENKRRTSIAETGKGAWKSALLDVRKTGKYPEFTPRENDLEFNTKWVEPLTNKAVDEYGKFVSYLGQNGLQKLDPEFGKGLASMAIRAIGYDTATARADALERELAELQANTQRINSVLRPQVGAGGGANGLGGAPRPSSPQSAAKAILNQIGVK